MKYLSVILLPLLFTGCVGEHMMGFPPHTSLTLSNAIWTADGSKVIAFVDSGVENGLRIRIYDKSGTLIQSYNYSGPYPGSPYYSGYGIWASNDDSTFFSGNYFSSYGNITQRYSFLSGQVSDVAGGTIYAESNDRNHLLIGPYSSQNNSPTVLIVDVTNSKSRLQTNWTDASSQYTNSLWMGDKNVGYYRYNNLNLVDFLIRDTSGTKLDSFDITYLMTGGQIFYGPGTLYSVGYGGILKIDSAAKTNSALSSDNIGNADISSDGNFIAYSTNNLSTASSGIYLINCKTGIVKKAAGVVGINLKISPSNDYLAYIDKTDQYIDNLVIIPVSAP
jgi:hypothetical protein